MPSAFVSAGPDSLVLFLIEMPMTPFAQKVALSLSSFSEAMRGRPLFCALSGGADSVALLLVLQELSLPLRALHCNFALRGEESLRDERFVRSLCAERNVPLEVRCFDTLSEAARTGESVEMAARRLRYAWFAVQPHPVAVGHHADDNVETLLLNLVRGTGLRGLSGMSSAMDRHIVRPLLGVTRAEILDYLAVRRQSYVHDSSNDALQHRRNFVRHRVLPLLRELNPSIDRTLADTVRRLSAAEEVYEVGLATLSARHPVERRDGKLIFPLSLLSSSGAASQLWLHEQLTPFGFEGHTIARMLAARSGALFFSPSHLATPHGAHLEVAPLDTLYSGSPAPLPLPSLVVRRYALPAAFRPSRQPQLATIDADAVVGTLRLRTPSSADRLTPFGMQSGTKLLSDLLTDRRRSRIDKLRTLVVCDEVGIVWVVGETIAQRVAITAATRAVLELALAPSAPSAASAACP